jgi:hypothetical protein
MDVSSDSWSVYGAQSLLLLIAAQNAVTFFIADQTAEILARQSKHCCFALPKLAHSIDI